MKGLSYQTNEAKKYIEKLPKVDLHYHLDGGLSDKTIIKVASDYNITIPGIKKQTLKALNKVYPNPGPFDTGNLQEFLGMFSQAFSVLTKPEPASDATYETLRELSGENIFYVELRLAPSYLTSKTYKGKQYKEMISILEGIKDGMKRAERDFNIQSGLIVCIPREIPYTKNYKGPSPELIYQVAKDVGACGLDTACDEASFPPHKEIMDVYKACRNEDTMGRTFHAGEQGEQRAENIRIVLEDAKPNRIGHGLPVYQMKDMHEYLLENKIGIERNPISNKIIGEATSNWNDFDELRKEGIHVTVNSDDPGVFGPVCSTTNNYFEIAKTFSYTPKELEQLVNNSIDVAFVQEGMRKELRRRFYRMLQEM